MDPDAENTQRLRAVLNATDAQGQPAYSQDDVLALAILVLREVPEDGLTAHVKEVLQKVAQRVGATGASSPEDMSRALQRFLTEHPAPPALVTSLQQALREGRALPAAVTKAFAQFAGSDGKNSLEGLKAGASKAEMSGLSVLLNSRGKPRKTGE